MSPIQIESSQSAKVDWKYVAVLIALLILIVAMLAQLWLIERNRRVTAEGRLAELYLKEGLLVAAKSLETGEQVPAGTLQPVRRQELPSQSVTWNGQAKFALLLSAATGKAMGFAPGDIIVVAPEIPPLTTTRIAPQGP
jgi:hypothetical protein